MEGKRLINPCLISDTKITFRSDVWNCVHCLGISDDFFLFSFRLKVTEKCIQELFKSITRLKLKKKITIFFSRGGSDKRINFKRFTLQHYSGFIQH